ncbi:MAG: hypothetical protein KHZ93_09035 [Clostridiales bacterium]|nr:hypothetical protein [Clostridiales bacterium]
MNNQISPILLQKATRILNQYVREDRDFLRLEQSKKALLRDLRKRLAPEDYRRLYEIVEIMDRQLTIASSYLLQSSQ